MGKQASEVLELDFEGLLNYLRREHSCYMQIGTMSYYLTDANDRFWRAQDTNKFNDKGHFVDASELVENLNEFLELPFVDGKSIRQVFDQATFYPSIPLKERTWRY